jgi:DNA-directed RNA polymerase specialized sigma subunit
MNLKTCYERDLLKQHAPLVTSAVSQLTEAGPQIFSDGHLHCLGLIALLEAARNYQPDCSTSFEAFARAQIQTALHDETTRAKNWFNGAPATTNQPTIFA